MDTALKTQHTSPISFLVKKEDFVKQRIAEVFRNPVQRLLMIAVPEIDRKNFSLDVAKGRRYPCFPPYGPAVLVSCVEAAGYTADIVDLHYEVLQAAVNSADEKFEFDAWKEPLYQKISNFRPDVIGLSGMFSHCATEYAEVARFLKTKYPDLPIISGGVYVSLMVDRILREIPEIDFILFNQADQTLVQFLDVANKCGNEESIKGVATRNFDGVPLATDAGTNSSFDKAPDYKGLPIANYANYGTIGAYTFLREPSTPSATVISRRGCRAACTFCSVRTLYGKGVQTRAGHSVVDEIQNFYEKYKVRHIMWLDDDLFYDVQAAIIMFKELASRSLPITWDASNGVIAAAITKELLEVCKASGCIGLNIGIESGNADILRQMRKPGNVRSFKRAANCLGDFPEIFTKGFLLVGYPGESTKALNDTVKLADALDFDWYPSQIVMPMDGTPVRQTMLFQDEYGETTACKNDIDKIKSSKFSVGVTGIVRHRELSEKNAAEPFFDPFSQAPDYIPDRNQMVDVWFAVDYKVNYKPIISELRPEKLFKKRAMLKELVQRMGIDHPLAALFLGICEAKIGKSVSASKNYEIARRGILESEYWYLRFQALGINDSCAHYFQQ